MQKKKKITYERSRLLALLMASMVTTVSLSAAQPKLVVGIVIDGLQQEYLDLLHDSFGDNGFRRLMRNGVLLENVDFGTNLDPAASTAVIMTGASPAVNGIGAATRYDRSTQRGVDVFEDASALGNYTDRNFSPKALRITTLADESVIAGAGVTYAYSIAPDAEQAIAMAGHAATGALWIDDKTGNWASSAYYRDMPVAAVNRNRLDRLALRLDTMDWRPAAQSKEAGHLPDHLTTYPFRHAYRNDKAGLAAFKSSPLVNLEITSLASDLISGLKLGNHDGPDMINLAYTLKPYEYTKTGENRYETIDSYIKLDSYIASLLKNIDAGVGAENTLVYVTGTAPTTKRRRQDSKWNLPGGEFSTRRAASLLNIYLISVFGNGDWVSGYWDNQFYLNTSLIEKNGLDARQVRREAAYLLNRMSGVERATTIDDIIDCTVPCEDPQALMRNTVVETAGDVRVQLIPGWSLVDDQNNPSASASHNVVHALTTAPAIIAGYGMPAQRVSTRVDARAIAPTVAGQMFIRPPNGAAQPPLRF